MNRVDDQKKYISFDPWAGGFSNVRMSYELAAAISIITNRILILPAKIYCDHVSKAYIKDQSIDIWSILDKNSYISQFNCVDYYSLPEYSNLESNNQYFENIESIAKCIRFDKKNTKKDQNTALLREQILISEIRDQKDFNEFSLGREIINLNVEDKFIHFPRNLFGHFYYHVYGSSLLERNLIKTKIKAGIKFKQEFLDKGYAVKQALKNYNAIHIRRGDFYYTRKDVLDNLQNFTDKILNNIPLYIATDEKNLSFFDILKQRYQILFLKDFYTGLLPHEALAIEQIICSEAEIFLGSKFSTYSDSIHILRGLSNKRDFHREGTNYKLPILNYNKYPWEVEPYSWENIHETYWKIEN